MKLTNLDLADKRAKYPNVPLQAITTVRFKDKSANALTRAIIRWLELHGCWATRITTTGRRLPGDTVTDVIGRTRTMAGKWIPGTTKKGTADIHAVIGGRHCSIEVKIGLDRMSDSQHKTKRLIESSGGLFFIAKNFESFVLWYENIKLNQ